jgi:hypothetical protein
MKRCAFTVVAFVLLGAVVNVAAAWGCALFINPVWPPLKPPTKMGMRHVDDSAWEGRHERQTGTATFFSGFNRNNRAAEHGEDPNSFLPRSTIFRGPSEEFQRGRFWQDLRCVTAYGWPTLSLWHLQFHFNDHGDNKSSHGGIAILSLTWPTYEGVHMTPTTIPRVLPLVPLWPGFAINTIFYATLLWMLWATPFALRRCIRVKRGLCPKCGYNRTGLPPSADHPCPECGTDAQGRTQKAQTQKVETSKAEMK